MEASELRIGNWVEGSNNGFSKYVQVYAFDHEHIQHTSKENDPLEYSCFKPIPLTEEILLKCGFDFSLNRYSPRVGKFILETGDEGYIFFTNDDYIEVKYLHQLQNLYFALTGEELNVQL